MFPRQVSWKRFLPELARPLNNKRALEWQLVQYFHFTLLTKPKLSLGNFTLPLRNFTLTSQDLELQEYLLYLER